MKHSCLQAIRDEHASLAAMFSTLRTLLKRGPADSPEQYFDVLRAMLFYVDEFPERLHHTKESELLFPRVAALAPQLRPLVERLEQDHRNGEKAVRELQHLLLAWELLGESRRAAFVDACERHLDFYQEHMRLEETEILPQAQQLLSASDWHTLDAAFKENSDPLGGRYPPNPAYDRLFTLIVLHARMLADSGDGAG